MWSCICTMKLYFVNYVCERVSIKANKVNETIHQLTGIFRYADIREEIHQFILQAIHRPLKFTGLGLFCFGSKLLWKFCAMISTLLLLMLQWSPELQKYNDSH
ncbi:PREDICTED: uncharacterized protein LOC106748064 [Dinoponera quadriceps]|uniref:Uncharacterized protein LOC106748064 n=1 Tax=Dinoponera quadriceps TaxID=609295 RepID=A0A6P3XTG4_DINQU|nr:PREDICTED: uncharacterized protein LOC106748064 [Dinoponera quadriceps]